MLWTINQRLIKSYCTTWPFAGHYRSANTKRYWLIDNCCLFVSATWSACNVTHDISRAHDAVIKWKHFSLYWPFVRGIHRSPVTQSPVTRRFDVFFDKRLCKQSRGWWFETPPCSLWRHCNFKGKGWDHCHCPKANYEIIGEIIRTHGVQFHMYADDCQLYITCDSPDLNDSTHYDDVRMGAIASQITSLAIFYSAFYSGVVQRKHQSSASLAFVWGIHRDRWIPRTKGQLRGKCFHLMTSSW